MPSIAALLTCFNRKALTLQCLHQLLAQQGLGTHFQLQIFLVDDGCTDGTAEAVQQAFPEVTVIAGNGQLYWNGGMRLAWQTAVTGNYDFYLWVNDDSMIYQDSIIRLLHDYKSLSKQHKNPGAIAGTLVTPTDKKTSYGGHRSRNNFNHINLTLLEAKNSPQMCDAVDGNFVLIPERSRKTIGILSQVYKHAYGDYDYSFRLQQAGLSCWIGSGVHGECTANTAITSLNENDTFANRLRKTKNLERLYPYKDHMYFVRKFSGPFWPAWWLKAWLRGNLPILWLILTRKPNSE